MFDLTNITRDDLIEASEIEEYQIDMVLTILSDTSINNSEKMSAISDCVDGFCGVEFNQLYDDSGFSYINSGDVYNETIVYDDGVFFLAMFSDYLADYVDKHSEKWYESFTTDFIGDVSNLFEFGFLTDEKQSELYVGFCIVNFLHLDFSGVEAYIYLNGDSTTYEDMQAKFVTFVKNSMFPNF